MGGVLDVLRHAAKTLMIEASGLPDTSPIFAGHRKLKPKPRRYGYAMPEMLCGGPH